jgi:hypothetical protein
MLDKTDSNEASSLVSWIQRRIKIMVTPGMEADAGMIDELKMGQEVSGDGREALVEEAHSGAWCWGRNGGST